MCPGASHDPSPDGNRFDQIYRIDVGQGLHAPAYATQDEALDIARAYPVGETLMWEGIDSVAPCWLRIMKGDRPHFFPAFELESGDNKAYLVALMRGDEIDTQRVLALSKPPENRNVAFVDITESTVGSTLLGPAE